MNDVVPEPEQMDDDFNIIPPILGMSTRLFMQTPVSGEPPIPLYVCLKCGGTSFEVGRISYTTVARCVACRIEKVIHDG